MSPGASSILFKVPARGVSRVELRSFIRRLQDDLANGVSFSCLITNDEELLALNKQFRGVNHTTDVLSFPSDNRWGSIGDIAISWDRAAEQAAGFGHTVDEELRILILHGVLHLTGMDHEKDDGEMAQAELRWRKRLKLPVGIIERANS